METLPQIGFLKMSNFPITSPLTGMETCCQEYFPTRRKCFPITSPLTGMETRWFALLVESNALLSDHISPNGDGNFRGNPRMFENVRLSDHISPNGDGNDLTTGYQESTSNPFRSHLP